MPHSLIHGAAIAGRVLAGGLGCVCFYLAFFLYEDEEGRWQNRIDDLWVAVDDRARVTESVSTALFNKIGQFLRQAFDRIFGHHLFSVRSFCASTTMSLLGFMFLAGQIGIVFSVIAIVFLVSAISPTKPE
jgi:hypothetical protein